MRIYFFEAEQLSFVETPVPLSVVNPDTSWAISFYSALLHKKDAAAIGAILEAVVARCYMSILINFALIWIDDEIQKCFTSHSKLN